MAGQVVITVRCQYCSKGRNPHEILHLPGGVTLCLHCHEWHLRALRMLGGEAPPGCQECGLTFDELYKTQARGNLAMTLVPKDGIYQVLCKRCGDKYYPKRADLLGGTEFGSQIGL